MAAETIAWFAGVDWGSERHQVCLVDAHGTVIGERDYPHSAVGLAELGDWILSISGTANAVAVAIEVPHGPVVDALLDRGFLVYAINPKQLDRLRDRFSVAGAKDDRRDAYASADGLRTDRHLFRRLQVADPRLVELRAWSRLAEELQEERVRLRNRAYQQLWRYYPQMLGLTDDLAATWFLELWERAPSPAKAAGLRKPAVERLLKQHRVRRVDADAVLRILRQPAIKVADGVVEAATIHMSSLVARLRVSNRELKHAERKLDELCVSRPSPSAAANPMLSPCAMPRTSDCAGRSTIGRVSPPNTTTGAAPATPPSEGEATRTAAPSAASPTGFSPWLAFSCNDRRCSTLASARLPPHNKRRGYSPPSARRDPIGGRP